MKRLEAEGRTVRTAVLEAGTFWPAEDYHQKWRFRRGGAAWAEAWIDRLGGEEAFRDATSAARLNGWFGGHGAAPDAERLQRDFGLGPEEAARLSRELGRF